MSGKRWRDNIFPLLFLSGRHKFQHVWNVFFFLPFLWGKFCDSLATNRLYLTSFITPFRADHLTAVCIPRCGHGLGGAGWGLTLEAGWCSQKARPGGVAPGAGSWYCVSCASQGGIQLQGSTAWDGSKESSPGTLCIVLLVVRWFLCANHGIRHVYTWG